MEFVSGVAELRAALARAAQRGPSAMGAAMYAEAHDIMSKSKALAPVDRGPLRASGTVFAPEISGGDVTVEFGYGGAASAYAVVQHERTDFHHDDGQAKFLEQPTLEAANGLESRLAAKVRRVLEQR